MDTHAPHADLAVEARNLVKVFGDNRAVDGVDLLVPKGMIYGVLGPNGAGKSTVINMLATLLKPDGGSAKIFGHDVFAQPQVVRQLIGVTGQAATVDDLLSATENLTIFGRLLGLTHSEATNRAKELLEEFGLHDAARKPLAKFSGGMRRRLDLAASLIVQPPLIFLDEPTTGLDPRTRNQLWETIRRLVKNGSTIVLTTQYLEEADQLADRIALIDQGRVIIEGTPDDLKAAAGVTTLHLNLTNSGDAQQAKVLLEKILSVRVQISDPSQLSAPMTNPDVITDLLIALRKADLRVAEISVQKPSLDEVFLALTGTPDISKGNL